MGRKHVRNHHLLVKINEVVLRMGKIQGITFSELRSFGIRDGRWIKFAWACVRALDDVALIWRYIIQSMNIFAARPCRNSLSLAPSGSV